MSSPNELPAGLELIATVPGGGASATPDVPDAQPAQAASHYDRSELILVTPGMVVARIKTPDDGQPPAKVDVGENLKLAEDGRTILAEVAGQLKFARNRIWVQPVLDIRGNVDFHSGNIDYSGNVIVRGNVSDLFRVKAGGSVFVQKTIEAAEVRAGTDLRVNGGIAGRDKGVCGAGTDVVAKYIMGATVTAGNNVRVEVEVASSTLSCGGALTVSGPIHGSCVTANGGVSCQVLGSPNGAQTFVEAGRDEALREMVQAAAPELDKIRAQVTTVRQNVEPLMRELKKLTAAQKERATELLYEADEREAEVNKKSAALKAAAEASQKKCDARINVSEMIHPGVVIRLGGFEKTFTQPMKGPVKIVVHGEGGNRQLATVSPGGFVHPLGGTPVDDPTGAAVAKILKAA